MTAEAKYWSRFDGTATECIPPLTKIQKIAEVGFTLLAFGEIKYNNQPNDIDNCIYSRNGYTPTNNPITECIKNIKNSGMEAGFIMNINRYGGVANLLDRPADRDKFKQHLQYISGLGAAIELEEFQPWYDYTLNPVTGLYDPTPKQIHMDRTRDYIIELRSVLSPGVKFGANFNSNMYINIQAKGVNPPDANELLDFIVTQPGKSSVPPYLITNDIIQSATDNYKTIFPKPIIKAAIYQQYSCPNAVGRCINANLIENIRYAVQNNINFPVWPIEYVTDAQLNEIKSILMLDNNCPPPQYSYTITQE